MTLRIFPKPSKNCGKCKELGFDCFCICHKEALFEGYHESAYHLPSNKVEDVTEFEDDKLLG